MAFHELAESGAIAAGVPPILKVRAFVVGSCLLLQSEALAAL